MEYPRLDHTGQNKKERPEQRDNKMRRKGSRRPGLEHPGRIKRQGPPPPRRGHPGTSGCQTPERAHPGRNKEHRLPPDWNTRNKRRPNAADKIIRGGSSSTSRRTSDWITRGQRLACPELEHPGWNRQREPSHPRHESRGTRGGQMPLTGASGAEQEGATTTTGAGKRWFAAPGRNARGGSTRRGPHPPGLERPGERGGQRRRKQEAETKVVQRRRQDRKQRKGQGQGNAGRQGSGRGRGDAGQQR